MPESVFETSPELGYHGYLSIWLGALLGQIMGNGLSFGQNSFSSNLCSTKLYSHWLHRENYRCSLCENSVEIAIFIFSDICNKYWHSAGNIQRESSPTEMFHLRKKVEMVSWYRAKSIMVLIITSQWHHMRVTACQITRNSTVYRKVSFFVCFITKSFLTYSFFTYTCFINHI